MADTCATAVARILCSLVALPSVCAPALARQSHPRNPACTFVGNDGEERAQGICLLSTGDVVVCGETDSDFRSSHDNGGPSGEPLPVGGCPAAAVPNWPGQVLPAWDQSLNEELPRGGRRTDAYVAVFSADSRTLKAWTYLGGKHDERAYAVAEGSGGTIWVCGFTDSPVGLPSASGDDFPATHTYGNLGPPAGTPAYPQALNEYRNAFVCCFTPSLNALLVSVVIGGERSDTPRGSMTVSTQLGPPDLVFLSGRTQNAGEGFPTSTGPPHQGPGSGWDAFVLCLDGLGNLRWSTLLGGSGDDSAEAGIRHDVGSNRVFVGGDTRSSDLPMTSGAHKPALSGAADAFLARLTATGSGQGAVEVCTYLGGAGFDAAGANDNLELDGNGNVVLSGYSSSPVWSPDFAEAATILPEHSQPAVDQGAFDAFVVVLDPSLRAPELIFGSYFGGRDFEEPAGLAVDGQGRLYLSGTTMSDAAGEGFLATPNAFDSTYSSYVPPPGQDGIGDGFLIRFDYTRCSDPGGRITYATYFGGDCHVEPNSIFPGEWGTRVRGLVALPVSGGVLLCGGSTTSDLPALAQAAFPRWRFGQRDGWWSVHLTD